MGGGGSYVVRQSHLVAGVADDVQLVAEPLERLDAAAPVVGVFLSASIGLHVFAGCFGAPFTRTQMRGVAGDVPTEIGDRVSQTGHHGVEYPRYHNAVLVAPQNREEAAHVPGTRDVFSRVHAAEGAQILVAPELFKRQLHRGVAQKWLEKGAEPQHAHGIVVAAPAPPCGQRVQQTPVRKFFEEIPNHLEVGRVLQAVPGE